jgi:hypothetical protein
MMDFGRSEDVLMMRGALHFEEVQSLLQNRLARLAGAGLLCALVGLGFAGTLGTLLNPGVIVPLVVLPLVGFLLLFGEMRTEVRDDALYTRWFPLTRWHRFAWNEIQSCEAVTYRPIRDYGGWGIRCGRKGKAYNVTGNRGVQLELTNGKRLLLGSQQPDELAAAIHSLLPK